MGSHAEHGNQINYRGGAAPTAFLLVPTRSLCPGGASWERGKQGDLSSRCSFEMTINFKTILSEPEWCI